MSTRNFNFNNDFQITISDGTNTHTLNVPKEYNKRVSSILEAVEREMQPLTQEQLDAISERHDTIKSGAQPF